MARKNNRTKIMFPQPEKNSRGAGDKDLIKTEV